MATARALSLPEIVLEVLEHVFDEPVSERRPLLFALAQVSRIFRDPAVRMLWVDMPNIEPLFRLLSNCEVVPDPVNATATGEDEDGPSYTLVSRVFRSHILVHFADDPLDLDGRLVRQFRMSWRARLWLSLKLCNVSLL